MKISKPIFLAAVLLCTSAVSLAETRYITDVCRVPLRGGDGNQYRIIHYGLPSGTKLDFLEENADGEFARVRTEGGTEGWMRTQYLVTTPIARTQLNDANARAEKLGKENSALRERLKSLSESKSESGELIGTLQKENTSLNEELDEIKRVSANALKLDTDNRRLLESNQKLSNEVDVLKTDNARLRENKENEFFLNGAFAVLIGVMLTLIIPRMMPKKRSEWV